MIAIPYVCLAGRGIYVHSNAHSSNEWIDMCKEGTVLPVDMIPTHFTVYQDGIISALLDIEKYDHVILGNFNYKKDIIMTLNTAMGDLVCVVTLAFNKN